MKELKADIEMMLVNNLNFKVDRAKELAKKNVDLVANAMYECITEEVFNFHEVIEEERNANDTAPPIKSGLWSDDVWDRFKINNKGDK
jgi:hypothetical protein